MYLLLLVNIIPNFVSHLFLPNIFLLIKSEFFLFYIWSHFIDHLNNETKTFFGKY